MTLLVVGSTGQVGRALVAHAHDTWPSVKVVTTSRNGIATDYGIDLGDTAAIATVISDVQPSYVVLAAAATNVVWCEVNPAEAQKINVEATEAVAEACRQYDAKLTFFSTDYVFDGQSGPYLKESRTHPINVYGNQKLAAEDIVTGTDSRNLVVRTSQVFGDDPRRTNFVLRTVDELRRTGALSVARDLFGTPTYVKDLVRTTLELMRRGETGVWHVAGDEYLSRHEFAVRVARHFELPATSILAFDAAEREQPLRRPMRSGLRCGRMNAAAMPAATSLDDALSELASLEVPS